MKKLLTILTINCLLSITMHAQSDKEKIRTTFGKYQKAIADKNPAALRATLDSSTSAFYQTLYEKYLKADSIELLQVLAIEQILILRLRLERDSMSQVEPDIDEMLAKMLARSQFALPASVDSIAICPSGDSALVYTNRNSDGGADTIELKKTHQAWKIDLTGQLTRSDDTLRRLLNGEATGDRPKLFEVLENMTGIVPTNRIWLPVKK